MGKEIKMKKAACGPKKLMTTVTVKKTGKTKHVKAPKIRSSLTPGTVCILLAGPYKGKRVIMLKSLASGNIVVTGPYSVNGIPLRRANPRYVAATSTKVPVDGIDVSKFDDTYFNKTKTPRRAEKKEKETVFANQGFVEKKELPAARKEDQRAVDAAFEQLLGQPENALLKQYLKTRFTLRDRMYPHAMRF